MIAIFLLAFTLSLFSFGTTPAAAGDVAGVSTHLFLTVLRDYDHDASFSVTYTDALGTHTKPYHAGMEVTAWSPVTITCTNHHVHDWSIDADVQEATIVGVGGITYPGGTGIHVKGTNTIKAFATNFGLHYINIVVILGEGNDNGGDNGGDNGLCTLSLDAGCGFVNHHQRTTCFREDHLEITIHSFTPRIMRFFLRRRLHVVNRTSARSTDGSVGMDVSTSWGGGKPYDDFLKTV